MHWLLFLSLVASGGSCLLFALSAHRRSQLTFNPTTRITLRGISYTTLAAGAFLMLMTIWQTWALGVSL